MLLFMNKPIVTRIALLLLLSSTACVQVASHQPASETASQAPMALHATPGGRPRPLDAIGGRCTVDEEPVKPILLAAPTPEACGP
jgi:hypothetical protein